MPCSASSALPTVARTKSSARTGSGSSGGRLLCDSFEGLPKARRSEHTTGACRCERAGASAVDVCGDTGTRGGATAHRCSPRLLGQHPTDDSQARKELADGTGRGALFGHKPLAPRYAYALELAAEDLMSPRLGGQRQLIHSDLHMPTMAQEQRGEQRRAWAWTARREWLREPQLNGARRPGGAVPPKQPQRHLIKSSRWQEGAASAGQATRRTATVQATECPACSPFASRPRCPR